MGRLIDADAFVKEYSQISEKFRNNEIMRMMIDHFIDAVKTFPTAYDKEAVINELENQAEQYRRRGFEFEKKGYSKEADKQYGKQCSYLNAVNIVKVGGIDG